MGKLIINRLLDLLNNVQLIVLMATKKKNYSDYLKENFHKWNTVICNITAKGTYCSF